MAYIVTPPNRGQRQVQYTCPHCRAALASPLQEAGQQFPCPTCGHRLTVPGAAELQQQNDEAAAAEACRMAEARQRQAHQAEEERRRESERRRREAEQRAPAAAHEGPAHPPAGPPLPPAQRQGISPLVFALVLVVVVGLLYLTLILPLQRRATRAEAGLEALTAKLTALTQTVKRDGEAIAGAAKGLDALTQTVNHNAETANRNIESVSRELAVVGRLARNADSHAHTHY